MVSGEVRHPERNIPIGLILGVSVVAMLYMLTNAAVQYVLPASAVAGSERPASQATAIAVGAWGAGIVSAGMALSMLVSLNGTIMSGARVPYAMARDGYFFKALADVNPRFHTPSVALVVQLVLSIFLLLFARKLPPTLLAGDFRRMALLHDRRQHRFCVAQERTEPAAPYHTWGYPVVPRSSLLPPPCCSTSPSPRTCATPCGDA